MHIITFGLLIIGGLNWGIFGITGWDVGQLFGGMGEPISRIIYVLVGVAALIELFTHKMKKHEMMKSMGNQSQSGM